MWGMETRLSTRQKIENLAEMFAWLWFPAIVWAVWECFIHLGRWVIVG